VKQRRFVRELDQYAARKLRAEHQARLQIQMELEREAKQERRTKLRRATVKYAADRARVQSQAARRRARIRGKANLEIDQARRARKDERRWWRDFRAAEKGQRVRKAKRRISKSESDSLAEHNIDPELVDFWRLHRHRFPYNREPDDRAVLFSEWVGENPDELAQWRLEQAAAQDWQAAELAHYQDQLGDELAAVPF
jgi:hypothetical protein